MSILVTGASGFLGGSLIKHLCASQQTSSSLNNNSSDDGAAPVVRRVIGTFRSQMLPRTTTMPDAYQSLFTRSPKSDVEDKNGIVIFQAEMNIDFTSEHSLEQLFAKYDDIVSVIHLGFHMEFHPEDSEDGQRMTALNLDSARNLIRAVRRYQHVHQRHVQFIFASSQESMGPSSSSLSSSLVHREAANEESPCHPTYLYGQNKRDVELMLLNQSSVAPSSVASSSSSETTSSSMTCSKWDHVEYTILRVCGVTGRGDRYAAFEMIQAVSRGLLLCYPGSCHGMCSFVHVSDVISAIVLCLNRVPQCRNQVLIIGPDSSVTFRQCIDAICDQLGYRRPLFTMPAPIFKTIVSWSHPLYNMVRNSVDRTSDQRHSASFLFHPDTVDNLSEDRWYSSEKAKRLLGYRPMGTEQAIRLATREHLAEGVISQRPLLSASMALRRVATPVLIVAVISTLFTSAFWMTRSAGPERNQK